MSFCIGTGTCVNLSSSFFKSRTVACCSIITDRFSLPHLTDSCIFSFLKKRTTGNCRKFRIMDIGELALQLGEAVEAEDYTQAHRIFEELQCTISRQGKNLELMANDAFMQQRQVLQQQQRLELLTFTKIWEEKEAVYERQSNAITEHLQERQKINFDVVADQLWQQLSAKKPRPSKKALELRTMVAKLAKQRRFQEAASMKQQLVDLEGEEQDKHEKSIQLTFESKLRVLQNQNSNEMAALHQRIKSGNDELCLQRKLDFERLLQQHSNAITELEQSHKSNVKRLKDQLQRQLDQFGWR
eukprot:TRINITY_DN8092_c0_g1_i1.p1 TRINITY_DN8092_c0_g1~~TRINITY_DN8092_c0_g1_i1.p1  ORF type:complete len:300 (-),score=54.20 TRINITY_DN8092_c0_g1_i1:8-907(-)